MKMKKVSILILAVMFMVVMAFVGISCKAPTTEETTELLKK